MNRRNRNERELDLFEKYMVQIRLRALAGDDVRPEIQDGIEMAVAERNEDHLAFAKFSSEYLDPKYLEIRRGTSDPT